jgi:hypothetical protein
MQCKRERIRQKSKVKKSSKTIRCKKSAKLLLMHMINYNFGLSAFIFSTSGVKIVNTKQVDVSKRYGKLLGENLV